MKRIRVGIITGGSRYYPSCADVLPDYPEFRLVVQAASLYESGVWPVLGECDVVLLEDAVIEQDGVEAVRSISEEFPLLRVLVVMDGNSAERVLEAIELGAAGVMARISIRSLLRRAIPVLYAGESWIPRDLAHSVREQLKQLQRGMTGNHLSVHLTEQRKDN